MLSSAIFMLTCIAWYPISALNLGKLCSLLVDLLLLFLYLRWLRSPPPSWIKINVDAAFPPPKLALLFLSGTIWRAYQSLGQNHKSLIPSPG